MSKSNLEEKLQSLSADYIYQQSVGSLLLLLISTMEEDEKGVTALPFPIPEDVAHIRGEIRTHLLNLEETLNGDVDNRIAALTHCVSLKKDLLTIYETIYSYFAQWNIFSTLISDQVALRKYKEDGIDDKQVEWSLFFADCHAFMESAKTVLDQKQYMGHILKCIPLSMTRDKFYDEVKLALDIAFTGESKEFLETSLKAFEGFCCPESNPLYGKYFDEIAQWLGSKKLILPQNLSDDDLHETYEELGEYFEILGNIEEYFACVLHDLNSLVLLFYLTYSFEELTEKDAAYSDLYHAVCEFVGGDWTITQKAAYLDRLNEQLEAAVEPVIDLANKIGKEEYELLRKIGTFDSFHEDTKKMLMMEEFIRDCFFGDLNNELFRFDLPEDLPMATKEEREALFTAFLTKTRASFDTLPVQTRKISMQTLMGALPPACTVQDVMDRLQQAIENAPTLEQKVLVVDKIGMIFSDCGYETLADEEVEKNQLLQDHHHDHNCGCGHDHHDHHHHDHD